MRKDYYVHYSYKGRGCVKVNAENREDVKEIISSKDFFESDLFLEKAEDTQFEGYEILSVKDDNDNTPDNIMLPELNVPVAKEKKEILLKIRLNPAKHFFACKYFWDEESIDDVK